MKKENKDLISLYLKIKNEKNIEIGIEPLMKCLENNYNEEIIKILINNSEINQKDNKGRIPLIYSLKKKYPVSIIKLFIKKDADLNLRDEFGNSPLLVALKKKFPEKIIKLLLNEKTDINLKDKKGNSPFLIALKNKYSEKTIKLLINEKSEINKKKIFEKSLNNCFRK